MGSISSQGGVKAVQRGQIYASGGTGGTAPENRYLDVTISAVVVAKARVNVSGVLACDAVQATADGLAQSNDRNQPTANKVGEVLGYLLNATTLRIYGGMPGGLTYRFSGRWEVIEDN